MFAAIKRKIGDRNLAKFVLRRFDEGLETVDAVGRSTKPSGLFYISELRSCHRKIFIARSTPGFALPTRVKRKLYGGIDFGRRLIAFLRASGCLGGISFCGKCNEVFNFCVVPSVCPKCEGPVYFSETGVRHFGRKISGKIDAFVEHRGKFTIVEAKSASTYYKLKERKKIEESLSQHISQGNMYLGLCRSFLRAVDKFPKDWERRKKFRFYDELLGQTLDPEMFIRAMNLNSFLLLYEDKNTNDLHPHEMPYDHGRYLEDVADVKKFFGYWDAGELPPMTDNPKLCKWCDFQKECPKWRPSGEKSAKR